MSKVSQSAGCLTVTHNSLNVHVLHEQTQMLEQHLSAGLLLMLGDVCGFFIFFLRRFIESEWEPLHVCSAAAGVT